MDIREFEEFVPVVLARMRADGYGDKTMRTAEWVLGWFTEFCKDEGAEDVGDEAAADFCKRRFGFDIGATHVVSAQAAIRKPLLTAMELHRTGAYSKHHQPGAVHDVPECVKGLYSTLITDFVCEQREICQKTKARKIWVVSRFLTYVAGRGVEDIALLKMEDVDAFAESLSGYAPSTLRVFLGVAREALDWMADRGMVAFSGQDAFPSIRASNRSKIVSYFTRDEVERILASIDSSTRSGKAELAIVSLLAFTGMRAGDVMALDLSDVDWDAKAIRTVQQKTGDPLVAPLVDEVLLPLADYVRNARAESAADPDALFVTLHAPYTRMHSASSLHRMVSRCMEEAGVDVRGRHHGPHSLRHSLATNMLNADIPLCAISDVLGHSSTATTRVYLTVDASHARELALEVPL